MFTAVGLLLVGGILYSGTKMYRQLRPTKRWFRQEANRSDTQRIAPSVIAERIQENGLRRANRSLALSSVSLGVTTAGLFSNPIFTLVSIPVGLIIFAPTFRTAWQTLRHERRVTTPVLDATRVTLCIILGYHLALALDTWLRTVTHKLLIRTENDFSQTVDKQFIKPSDSAWVFTNGSDVQISTAELAINDVINVMVGDLIPVHGTVLYGTAWIEEQLVTGETKVTRKTVGDPIFADTTVVMGQIYVQVTAIPEQLATVAIRKQLLHTIEAGTITQQIGETSGRKMAPRMLAVFAILLPFWNPSRAAGFLTTSLGSQMGTLGSYTLRNFVNLAAQQHLLILDGRALEKLSLINTIIIDAKLLADPAMRLQAEDTIRELRERRWPMQEVAPHPFSVCLLADGDEPSVKQLVAEVGADDYFVEPLLVAQSALFERLRLGGKFICYVGEGKAEQASLMEKAFVSVAIPSATHERATDTATNVAQVVIVEKNLEQLIPLFNIANKFAVRQGFNVAWPLLMDILDIGTTVFFHLGLTYSVLFNYSGLLVSAANARMPLIRYRRTQELGEAPRLLPLRYPIRRRWRVKHQ